MSKTNIAVIALLLALIVLVLLTDRWQTAKIDHLVTRTLESNNVIKQYIDTAGRQVTVANSNYITKDELRHSTDRTIDSLRRTLVGPIKDLQQVTRIMYERIEHMDLALRDTVIYINDDTVNTSAFTYHTKYMDLKGFLLNDSLHMDYSLTGGWSLEYRWKPTKLFAPKELELTVKALDPAVKVNNIQQFNVITPVPFWKRPGVAFVGGMITLGTVQLLLKDK